jgi:two-component system OmpR family sensor kinase
MSKSISIARRLVVTVLLLELASAIALIGAIAIHERHIQMKAFDAMLTGTAQSLMGAVQDAEDKDDNVVLDLRGVQLGRDAIYRVEDEKGRVLGAVGEIPRLEPTSTNSPIFQSVVGTGRHYRFVVLHGLRIIDPGDPGGGTRHDITIVYGTPANRVWHETVEATRFFALATLLLIGVTAAIMVWLVRKQLSPLHDLAIEAGRINSSDWSFHPPATAKQTVELRPLTTALDAALGRLQRSFEQQKRFTSDAAHELKTDLAIVKSSMQLLSMRRRTVDEYERGLALSLDDFTRLELTVQKLLTLARLEQPLQSTSAKTTPPSTSLRDAVEEAIHQSEPLAQLRGVEVRFDSTTDAIVPVDSHDLLLLCSNILLNALQHSRSGVSVLISLTTNSQTVQLTIRDHGEGIAEEDRSYIFEPFYRGDPSRSRKSGGTGLGLSICKAICDRTNGSIELANHPAGGVLATVTLPALSAPPSPALSASIKAN